VVRSPDAYATVCGLPPAAEGTPSALPPCWPQVLAAPLHTALLAHARFPLPALGLVHVRQQITCLQPIPADAALDLQAWVEGHRVVRAGGEFDLVTHARLGGEVVWSGVTTLLSRYIRGDRTLPRVGARAATVETPATDAGLPTILDVPADIGTRYAQVSGDANPIHRYALAARLAGFRGPIAHGMWTLARALATVELPAAYTITTEFRAPVTLPSELTLTRTGARYEEAHIELRDAAGRTCVRIAITAEAPSCQP
jgi:acyl dehydratase